MLVLSLCIVVGTDAWAFDPPAALVLAISDDFPPYSFITESGEPRGYVRDLWELWSQRTGVKVSYLPMHWQNGAETVKAGKAQVIAALPKGTADPLLRLSAQQLAAVPNHIFYRKDIADIGDVEDLAPFSVGVVVGGSCDRFLRENDVRHLRPYPSAHLLMEAVAKGEIGVFCGGRANSLRALRERGLELAFRISPALHQGGIHWATRAWDAELHQFVANGFTLITAREREDIASRWQGAVWQSEVRRKTLRHLIYGLLAAVAAVMGSAAWILTLRRQVRIRTNELRTSELRSAALLNALPELAWIKDLDGRFLAVNQSLASVCGVTDPDAMVGRTAFAFFPGEVAEAFRRNDEQVIARQGPMVVVEPLASADGAVRWVETTKAPFLDVDGNCIGTVGMAREMTSRKQAEDALSQALDALKASEARYRSMIEALPVGVFELDRDGTVIFANERAWALLGGRAVRIDGEPWVNHVHPEDQPSAIVAMRALLTRGTPLRLEVRLRREGEDDVWVQASAVRNEETEGATLSVLDISEQRRAEDRLRARREEFRILAEHSPDTIARYDVDARRLYANSTLAAIAGCEPDALLGRTPSETVRSAEMQAYETEIRAVAATGCASVFELAWQGAGGAVVVTDIRLVPEFGRDGGISGVIAIGRDVTHLKAVEGELRAKSETLAALLANLPGNVFTMRYHGDGRKRLIYSSLADASRSVDLSPEALSTHFHPDDHDLLFTVVPDRLRRWGYSEHKFRLRLDDGTVAWMHARERVRQCEGEDMMVDGTVFDISEEMEAKQKLERTAEELRVTAGRLGALLDNLPGLAYRKEYWPDRAEVTYTSAGFSAMFGRDFSGGNLEARLADLWHPEDFHKAQQADAAVRDGLDVVETTLRYRHADGSVRWGLVRQKVVERRETYAVAEGLLIDITGEMEAKLALEQKAAELAEAARRFQSVLENLPGLIFRMEITPDGGKRMLELYGKDLLEGGELTTVEGLKAVVHPDDVPLMYEDLPARLRATGRAEQSFRVVNPGGEVRWAHTRERVVAWVGDTMIVEGQVVDITAEVLARQDLEDSERQRARAEARLQQGRRFEALGRFAGGIAHDFNNLLGAMLGYARFIEEDMPADSATRHYASRITAAGRRGRDIVDQILNYSRQMELSLSRFAVGDLVAEVASFCGVSCPQGVGLEVDGALSDSRLEADRLQLTRTLMNLCVNARDAMAGRNGTIRVGAHTGEFDHRVLRRLMERGECGDSGAVETWTDRDGTVWAVAGRLPERRPHVTLYVSDQGSGMDAGLLDNAFQPFFTTKDRSRGAGLGLAVVLGVVIAHGGALIVSSRAGEGSRFDILLPARQSDGDGESCEAGGCRSGVSTIG